MHRSKLQGMSEFQIKNTIREGLNNKWLPIFEERRLRLNMMMRLGISYSVSHTDTTMCGSLNF
jgi:hypothetical protein